VAPTIALFAATFATAFASGVIPFVISIELYLIGAAALSRAPAPAIIGLAVAGQMLGSAALYLAGTGALRFRFVRWSGRETALKTLEKYRAHSLAVVAVSSLTGLPPFYGVSLAAGAVRLPLASYLVVGTLGRIVRFTIVYLVPGWFGFRAST
jgi:membrane protein YqaA with SNARE-associated domain